MVPRDLPCSCKVTAKVGRVVIRSGHEQSRAEQVSVDQPHSRGSKEQGQTGVYLVWR